jgi:DNA-directed RNA polymerase alpha subunit
VELAGDDTPIEVLQLSWRLHKSLCDADIYTVGAVAKLTADEVLSLPYIRERSLAKIRHRLHEYRDRSVPCWAVLTNDSTPIAALGLSIRSYSALVRAGIATIGQLAAMPVELICDVPNIGIQSLTEIQTRLEDYAAHAPPPPDPTASSPASQISVPENALIDVLGLSIRPYRALMRDGIVSIGQLVQMSSEQILEIRTIGKKWLAEIEEKMETYLTEHPLLPPEPPVPVEPEPPSPLDDPTLLARAAKVPLDNIAVERLALPVHWHNQLHRRGIESVGELAQQPADAFDQDSPVERRLNRYLTWLVEQDEATWADEVAGRGISPLHRLALSETTLEVLVGQWLDAMGPQESWVPELTRRSQYRQVICWRYGLDGESLTLEEIGKHIGVSRERVRQIQGRALQILSKPQHREVVSPLRALLVHLLEQAGGLMSEAQVEVVLRHEVIVGDVEPVGVARLVFETEDNVKWLRETRAWGLTHYPLAEVDDVQHRLAQVLGKEQVPLPCEEVVSRFKRSRFYRNRQGKLGSGFIAACLRAHPRILINDEKLCSLERWERHRIDKIILALRKIGEPAHYQDIAQVTNELSPPELRTSPRVIHAQLGQHPDLFVWVGQRGTYGLKEWGLEKPPTYEEALVQVFKASERPLTIHKILALLPEVRQVCNENSVSMTLMMNERFRTFPDGTYGLSSWSLADDVEERTLPPDFLEDVKQRLFQELSEQAQAQSSIREVSRVMEG